MHRKDNPVCHTKDSGHRVVDRSDPASLKVLTLMDQAEPDLFKSWEMVSLLEPVVIDLTKLREKHRNNKNQVLGETNKNRRHVLPTLLEMAN